LARITVRVAALLAPLAPHGALTELPPSGPVVLESGAAPKKTTPALASPTPGVTPKGTAKLPRAKILALPGVDPTRPVRMKPISEEQIARRTNTAALPPRAPVAPRPVPARALAPVPPPDHAAARGAVQLSIGSLLGLVVLV